MTPRTLWSLERVTLAGARRPRLSDVTLEIHAGVTAVVGYSGAGKTSLLNLLTRFERPDSGRLTSSTDEEGRLPLFWVPQNDGLWPHLTAAQHLDTVRPSGSAAPSADELLGAFDLVERADATPERLSQGERSRLATARALASDAAVLVMDEPLAHVDPARCGRYWDVVREHCARRETSLVIATHSPEVVLREAGRAVCLKEGRVLFEGTVPDLYDDPPSPEVAGFLGAANWLTADEAARWLGPSARGDRCYRPERVAVVPARESPLVVESAWFAGSVAEVELRDERRNGVRRRFYHRPAENALRAGDRVLLRLSLILLACLAGLTGCGPNASGPALDVTAVDYWPMPADGPRIPAPRAMAVGLDHELYVLDNAGRVLVFDESGRVARQWHMPEYSVGNPEGVTVLRDGRIAVADTHYHRVVFFNRDGEVLGTRGELGEGPGEFIYPVAVAEDDAENLYVAEYGGNDRVQKFSRDGSLLATIGASGTRPGEFQRPSGLVWHDGRLYVADAFNNRLQVFRDSGEFLGIVGESAESAGLHYPYGLVRSDRGDLYVVEYGAGRVTRLDADGAVLGRYGSTGDGPGQFSTPWGLAVDGHKRVFVADTGNRRIVELKL